MVGNQEKGIENSKIQWVGRRKQAESRENEIEVEGGHQNWVIPKWIAVLTLDLGGYTVIRCTCKHKGEQC